MAQEKLKINDVIVFQPKELINWDFETTYSPGSTRTQLGVGWFDELFTVEQYKYQAEDIPAKEASKILKMVVNKKFQLHYFSPYYGEWRTDKFYVGEGSVSIESLKENQEISKSFTINMTGINPLEVV